MENTTQALPHGAQEQLLLPNKSLSLHSSHDHTDSLATSNNVERAKQLLLLRRACDPEYKAPQNLARMLSIKRKAHVEPTFSYKEANRALLSIVDTDGDIGIAEALLSLGADVNFVRHKSSSKWKKVANKNQLDQRSNLLVHAVTVARPELVALLAAHADQISLDDAMGEAIRRADLEILRTLLIERGASPLQWHVEFLHAVSSGRKDLVALLLSGRVLPCTECLSKALALTVATACLDTLQLLIDCGAIADFNSGEALNTAARARKADFVATLIAAPSPPSIQSLDLALSVTFETMSEPAESDGLEIMAQCLAAGARGPNLDQILVAVVRKKQSTVLDLLLEHSNAISVDHDSGEAIRLALEYQQLDVLDRLLAIRPSRATLNGVISTVMNSQGPTFRIDCMSRLLNRGAYGLHVAEALVTAVEQVSRAPGRIAVHGPETRLIQLLLTHADDIVNHNHGKALQLAIEIAPDHIIACMLDKQPDVDSLVAAFSAAIALADKDRQLTRVRMLMASGARGELVDKSLIHAVNGGTANIEMITTLLTQASVNYREGLVFTQCILALDTDILRLLLAKDPNHKAISTAARAAFSLSGPQSHSVFDLLLEFLSPSDLGLGLLQLSRETDVDLPLIRELLEAGARVEHQGGACLIHAASTYNTQLLELLGAFVRDESLYSQAFGSALDASPDWATIENIPVFRYLLDHGARGAKVSESIVQAASRFELGVLQALAGCIGVNKDIFSAAYVVVTTQSPAWLNIEHLDTMALLLAHGATGDSVAKSLSPAITALVEGRTSEALIDSLLEGNVDVNYKQGAAIQLAASYGLPLLLDKLMDAGGTSESALRALITAVKAGHSESLLLQIVDTLTDHPAALPDVNFADPDTGSLIYLSLQYYPDSLAVVTRFLDMGCDLQRPGIYCAVDFDEDMSRGNLDDGNDAAKWAYARDDTRGNSSSTMDHDMREPVTVLIYALLQTHNTVSSEVINTLISRGANIAYAAPRSKMTALMLASKHDRPEVVSKLIKSGAKVDMTDVQGRSTLFYAARTGSDQAVEMILHKKPRVNDGSLHEASRDLYPQVVQRLIAAKHDSNFRSPKHGGRTALGEMALHGDITSSTHYAAAVDTVDVLKDSAADPLVKCCGRTVIFLALDNMNPVPIAQVLLERLLWSSINDTANILQVGGHFYSPSMYVSKGIMRGPVSQQRHLMQLLAEQGCVDVFHAPFGKVQPEDAQGMPPDIAEFEKLRREREHVVAAQMEDHDNELLRDLKRAQQEDFIAQTRYQRDFSNRKQEADYRRENIYLDTDLNMKIDRAQMNNQMHMGRGQLEFEWQQHQQRSTELRDQRGAELEHESLIEEQRLVNHANDLRVMDEKRIIEYKERQGYDFLDVKKLRAHARTDLYHKNEIRRIDRRRERGMRHEQYKGRVDEIDFQERLAYMNDRSRNTRALGYR